MSPAMFADLPGHQNDPTRISATRRLEGVSSAKITTAAAKKKTSSGDSKEPSGESPEMRVRSGKHGNGKNALFIRDFPIETLVTAV